MQGGIRQLAAVLLTAVAVAVAGCAVSHVKPAPRVADAVATPPAPPLADAPEPEPVAKGVEAARPPPRPAPVVTAPPSDLWYRLRAELTFDGTARPEVRRELAEYRGQQRYFAGIVDRAEPYLHYIVEAIEKRGMPVELALLPILESGFEPGVVSPHGAAGLWQFMSGTGSRFGLERSQWFDGRLDVVASTEAALDYLGRLAKRFDGDWLLAVAAYNAGWGNIERAIVRNRRAGKAVDVWSLPVTSETHRLVARLLALVEIVRDPAAHDLELRPLPNEPYFARVRVDRPLDLRRFAAAVDVSPEELARLNPGFRRNHTGPGKSFELLLPRAVAATAAQVAANLPATPATTPAAARGAGPVTYRVRSGDSLWSISRRFKVTVDELKDWNNLEHRHTLQPGQELLVYSAS